MAVVAGRHGEVADDLVAAAWVSAMYREPARSPSSPAARRASAPASSLGTGGGAWPVGAYRPPGQARQISDVAGGILFLEPSPCIIGEILHIDGGQIAGH